MKRREGESFESSFHSRRNQLGRNLGGGKTQKKYFPDERSVESARITLSCAAFRCASRKINLLLTNRTQVRLVEFVGEDFLFFTTIGAFADKRA
jgi:hypothetical protein